MTVKNYVVYKANGKITKLLSINEVDLQLNLDNDDLYIEGTADFHSQYVENSAIISMPQKPDGEYVFNYDIKQWEFDVVTADQKAKQQRDKLLAEGPDRISPIWWSSMSTEEQQAWTKYRQDLLDITSQADYPEFIVWPIKPS